MRDCLHLIHLQTQNFFLTSFVQIIALFVNLVFLGQAFTIMLVYVWSRRNPYVRMNFFGLLTFKAPFLPWVLFGFSLMLGNSVMVDLIGKLHVLLSINVDGLVIPFAFKVQKQCRSGALLSIKCCNLFFIYSSRNKTTLQMYGAMQFLIYLNYTKLCQKSSQRTLVMCLFVQL